MGIIHYMDILVVTIPVTVILLEVTFKHTVLDVGANYQGVNSVNLLIFSQLVEHFRLFQQGDYLGVGVFNTVG